MRNKNLKTNYIVFKSHIMLPIIKALVLEAIY